MKDSDAKKILDKLQEDYNDIAESFSRTREKNWSEIYFLKDFVFNGDKILDVGCGNGRLFDIFNSKKIEYFGVDFSKKLIEIARRKYLPSISSDKDTYSEKVFPTFIRVNALNLPFEDNFFDQVFCIAVFHHIPSKKKRIEFLNEIRRVLKKHGEVHLTVWNLWTRKYVSKIFKEGIKKLFGKSKLDYCDVFIPFDKKRNRYYHCFRRSELKKLFLESGFKIKEIKRLKRRKKKVNIYVRAVKQ